MSFTAKTIPTVLLIFYPFIVYFGINHFDIRVISILLLSIFLAKFLLERYVIKNHLETNQSISTVILASVVCILALYYQEIIYLKFYPVCINLIFFVLFSSSLVCPPTMIEKFARIRHKNLNEQAVKYLRKVTIVWCIFFVINGSIAAYTALWTSVDTWTLYNGLVSYILMGGLFLVEFLYRRFTHKDGLLNE